MIDRHKNPNDPDIQHPLSDRQIRVLRGLAYMGGNLALVGSKMR